MIMFRNDYKKANKNISPSQELINNTANLMKQELKKQLNNNNELSADCISSGNSAIENNNVIKMDDIKKKKKYVNKYLCIAAGISFCFLSAYIINHYVKNDGIKTHLDDNNFVADVELKNGNISFEDNYSISLNNNDYLSSDNIISKDYTTSEYIEYLGSDPRPSYIPKKLKDTTPESQMLFTSQKDTIINDNYTFNYSNDDCSLKVTVSKDNLPKSSKSISDSPSRINSTEINASYDSSNNEYIASFIYNSVGYNIESKNISQKEFIKILLSIIQE